MEENPFPPDGERRRKSAITALHLTIGGLVLNIIGASVFWIELPERMKGIVAISADHEIRIRSLERADSEKAATLGRIDERTKSIQDAVTDLRRAK